MHHRSLDGAAPSHPLWSVGLAKLVPVTVPGGTTIDTTARRRRPTRSRQSAESERATLCCHNFGEVVVKTEGSDDNFPEVVATEPVRAAPCRAGPAPPRRP